MIPSVLGQIYLGAGVAIFLAAFASCFLRKLHPLGMLLLAVTLGLLGAASFQVSLATTTIDVFGAFSNSEAGAEFLLDRLGGLLQIGLAGLGLALAVTLVAALQWFRRKGELSRFCRLGHLPTPALIGVAVVMALLVGGFGALLDNSLRVLSISLAVVTENTEDLPAAMAPLLKYLEGEVDQLANTISFRLVAGTAGAMAFGLLCAVVILLALVTGWIREGPEAPPLSASVVRTRNWTGTVLVGLVALACLLQLWKWETARSWIPQIRAAVEKGGGGLPLPQDLKDAKDEDTWAVKVDPVYPEEARKAGITGQVLVRVTIDGQGNVTETSIVEGHPLLQQAAIDAVRQWKLRPELLEGLQPSESLIVNVEFPPD